MEKRTVFIIIIMAALVILNLFRIGFNPAALLILIIIMAIVMISVLVYQRMVEKMVSETKLIDGKQAIYAAPAKLEGEEIDRSGIGLAGYLYLTDSDIRFRLTPGNAKYLERHPQQEIKFDIPLDQIVKYSKTPMIGLGAEGFLIATSRREYKFLIPKADEWIRKIEAEKQKIPSELPSVNKSD